jgi:hypothetical protein
VDDDFVVVVVNRRNQEIFFLLVNPLCGIYVHWLSDGKESFHFQDCHAVEERRDVCERSVFCLFCEISVAGVVRFFIRVLVLFQIR